MPIDYDSENIEAHLSSRDTKFREGVLEHLSDNLETHRTELGYNRAANKPGELISSAQKALEAIDQRHKAFSAPDVLDQVEVLNQKTLKMLNDKSPKRLLSRVVEILESINIDKTAESKEELLPKISEVNRISFDLKKKLGG